MVRSSTRSGTRVSMSPPRVQKTIQKAERIKCLVKSPEEELEEQQELELLAQVARFKNNASSGKLSDVAKVKNNLRIFNMVYLQCVKKKLPRPDLKASSKMKELNAILYPEKRIGELPGVNVGDHFFSRSELVSVGIHKHWLNGIDYISKEGQVPPGTELPLATAIVVSGGYEDDVDNADEIIYTGEGGNNLTGDRRQYKDQMMKGGNLALKNCVEAETPVRVIRGHDCKRSYTKRVYTYDGLYKVTDYWAKKGQSGHTVYMFKLSRCVGQPVLTTDQVRFCKGKVPESSAELRGLVSKDISNGLERLPIPATNEVDDEIPGGFTYTTEVNPNGIAIPPPATGCNCKGMCVDPLSCSCAKRNGKMFPYVNNHGARLAFPLDVVYECGPNCGCGPACLNRATQRGLQYRLEVYKTPHKGWGVRSWDSIPAGAPVCEYFGKLVKADGLVVKNDVYIFDLDCIQTMRGADGRQRRWNELRKLGDDEKEEMNEEAPEPGHAEFCLDGHEFGGVARFINHSCEPNLFIQCVLSSHDDMRLPRIVLFAADNIAPLEELSYDYGYQVNTVVGLDGEVKKMPCYCGAIACRKRLY